MRHNVDDGVAIDSTPGHKGRDCGDSESRIIHVGMGGENSRELNERSRLEMISRQRNKRTVTMEGNSCLRYSTRPAIHTAALQTRKLVGLTVGLPVSVRCVLTLFCPTFFWQCARVRCVCAPLVPCSRPFSPLASRSRLEPFRFRTAPFGTRTEIFSPRSGHCTFRAPSLACCSMSFRVLPEFFARERKIPDSCALTLVTNECPAFVISFLLFQFRSISRPARRHLFLFDLGEDRKQKEPR